jgi:ubiquinone/menaquinone biosynthesis C-methylase UbiE
VNPEDREDRETVALVGAGYDAVYEAVPRAPTLWQLWREHAAGADFPSDFSHISFVTLAELRHLGVELGMARGGTVIDLACGMGGPSLWFASEFPIEVVGIDVSAVAVDLAGVRAGRLGLDRPGSFRVGTFANTGLPAGAAAAAVSFDALQYAPDKNAACAEMARVVQRGGRIGITAFELDADRVRDLPVLGDDPVGDYAPLLEQAGFRVDSHEETPGWDARLANSYRAILDHAEDLRREMGDAGYGSLALEVALTLERRPYARRVLITATRR